MSSVILYQISADGYSAGATFTDGDTTLPKLDQYASQRVSLSVGGVSASASNPLPVVVSGQGSLLSSFSTLADVSVSTLVQLGSLVAANQGILLTAHPNNSAVIRVAGSNASTSRGQPLAPGASFVFPVANANDLWVIAETGTQTLCVAAV